MVNRQPSQRSRTDAALLGNRAEMYAFLVSQPTAAAVLELILPDIEFPADYRFTVDLIRERPWSKIFLLKEDGNPTLVLKWRPDDVYSETAVVDMYRQWRAAGVPVPVVEKVGKAAGGEYILAHYIPGVNGADHFYWGQPRKILLADLAKQLTRMREINAPRHGLVNGHPRCASTGASTRQCTGCASSPSTRKAAPCPISGLINDKFEIPAAVLVSKNIISRSDRSTLEAVFRMLRADADSSTPVLLHGDLGVQNSITDATTGALRAVFDPIPLGGDPLYDLAVLKHFHNRERLRASAAFPTRVEEIEDAGRAGWEIVVAAYNEAGRIKLDERDLLRVDLWELLIFCRRTASFLWHPTDEFPHMLELFFSRLASLENRGF